MIIVLFFLLFFSSTAYTQTYPIDSLKKAVAIQKEDTNKMNYEEYGEIVEKLFQHINQSNVVFNAVVPILRSGAIPGMMIAIKLKIINIYIEIQDIKY